ncbi:hypothetical protein [Piscibacillus salipiscarius]|uniref:Uncharacterized protein n=1 Tax=Piscibacillus salipiscarius TaxID=299480 RepID=A0ABW5Q932_9BACI|nr:hypothetical protein [Piscibacillus salipiscarius]
MPRYSKMTWPEWNRILNRIEDIQSMDSEQMKFERFELLKRDIEEAYDLEKDVMAKRMYNRVKLLTLKVLV